MRFLITKIAKDWGLHPAHILLRPAAEGNAPRPPTVFRLQLYFSCLFPTLNS